MGKKENYVTTKQNRGMAGTLVIHVLRLHLIHCAALTFMHIAALHIEQSAVSCRQRCLQSHLAS